MQFAIALAIGYTAYISFQRVDFLHSTSLNTAELHVYILAFLKELIFYLHNTTKTPHS